MANGRRIVDCKHNRTISTVTAGLERSVCEDCGHVSVRYIESTVHIFPDASDIDIPHLDKATPSETRRTGCTVCEAPAEFLIPGGIACAEHAWKEASKQQIMGSEPWIPISIDQRTNAS